MMAKPEKTTREHIIQTASRLFYAEGVRAVSMDALAEATGVTKRTLYYHFASKDELVSAYLEARDHPNRKLFARWYDEAEGGIPDKVEALFINLAKAASHPKWKGCGFLRTAAELVAMPGHPAMKACASHKSAVELWLCGKFEQDETINAAQLARQIAMLMDGAFARMLIHPDPAYMLSAGSAARQLIRCGNLPA